MTVPGEEHRSRPDPLGGGRVGERRPAEAVVVPGVEVRYEVESIHVLAHLGHERKWFAKRYGRWIADALTAALLA